MARAAFHSGGKTGKRESETRPGKTGEGLRELRILFNILSLSVPWFGDGGKKKWWSEKGKKSGKSSVLGCERGYGRGDETWRHARLVGGLPLCSARDACYRPIPDGGCGMSMVLGLRVWKGQACDGVACQV